MKLTPFNNQNTGVALSKSLLCKSILMLCALLTSGKINAQLNAQNDLFPVLQNGCNNFLNVAANDNPDTAAPSILLTLVSQPANGTASTNGDFITYCANTGFIGVDQFIYSINDGVSNGTATVYVNVSPPNNLIYPGDADQNGTVENFDVLSVGLTYGFQGPSRDTFTNNALAWTPLSFINTDPGATDCNGNGIITDADVVVIDSYFLSTFPVAKPYDVDTSACDADGIPFYIESLSGDSVMDGDSLILIIKLGDSTIPREAYGIAFTLEFDTGFIDGSQIQLSTANSWLVRNDTMPLTFKKDFQQTGESQIALTKTNHNPATGGGEIMRAILPIDDNIDGVVVAPGWHDLKLHLTSVRLISEYNIVRDVCIEQPTVKVFKVTTASKQPNVNAIKIYPNPSTGTFIIEGEQMLEVTVTDLAGKEIFSSTSINEKKTLIDLSDVVAGSYLATVKTRNSVLVQKIFIQP